MPDPEDIVTLFHISLLNALGTITVSLKSLSADANQQLKNLSESLPRN